MPAFDAGTVVEALDFTFEPFVKGCRGTIREPTDKLIAGFLSGIKKVIQEVQADIPSVAADDPAGLLNALDDLDPEIVVSLMAKMAGQYAKLCSGFPSAEQILELPMRQRQMFFGWLQSEVMTPEAGPGAGKAVVTQLPRAAAG